MKTNADPGAIAVAYNKLQQALGSKLRIGWGPDVGETIELTHRQKNFVREVLLNFKEYQTPEVVQLVEQIVDKLNQ